MTALGIVWSTHSTQDICYSTVTSFYPTFSSMDFNILAIEMKD